MKKVIIFGTIVFAVAAIAGLLGGLAAKAPMRSQDTSSRGVEEIRYGPGPIDIQTEGPLMDGQVTTVDQAIQITGYSRFPIPPTNELTGTLSNIWIDELKQVAFVWGTDLRLYINPLLGKSEGELVARWAPLLPEMKNARLTEVTNNAALAIEGTGPDAPSSLTWADPESQLLLQYVAPSHTVEQLKAMVEAFTYRTPS
jgi:hypothetical protein